MYYIIYVNFGKDNNRKLVKPGIEIYVHWLNPLWTKNGEILT